MNLFSENTHDNPLCFKDKTGFEAAWEQAALEDDTKRLIAKREAKKEALAHEDDFFANIFGKEFYA